MTKKILLISPTPSHPQNAGNRVRIFRLLSSLRDLGNEVHFAFVQMEQGDHAAMRTCWGVNFHLFEYAKPRIVRNYLATLLERIARLFDKNRKYVINVDDWYDPSIDAQLKALDDKVRFDVVFTEYVFLSKALENFGPHTLKLIDTHDVFSDRHKLYLANNAQPQWFSTSKKGERKGLRRADVVIAIQDQEKDFFSSLTGKRVISVGHLVDIAAPRKIFDFSQGIRLLFVASDNPINIRSIRDFIEKAWPVVKVRVPMARLVIAGRVCKALAISDDYVMLGEVEDIAEAYREADIAINPVLFGTGLNIKSVEALGYGLPLVSTSVGAKGLSEIKDKALVVADSPEALAAEVASIAADPALAASMSQAAHLFAVRWNHRHLAALAQLVASGD